MPLSKQELLETVSNERHALVMGVNILGRVDVLENYFD
jgi:hypothetical protein